MKTRGGLWEGKVKNRGSLHFLTEFLLRFAPLARTIFQLFLHVFYV